MIVDLHNHTIKSYDGFTTLDELLLACKSRGVDAVAITEHDIVSKTESEMFIKNGVCIISGCEFTNEFGAHIIGIFIKSSINYGSTTRQILDHIKSEGGMAILPHPFKPGSGYLALHGDVSLVDEFDFVEIVNGGFKSKNQIDILKRIASTAGVRMIASSDSHKASHVGLCCTKFSTNRVLTDIRTILKEAKQEDIALLVDRSLDHKAARTPNLIQSFGAYQNLLRIVPRSLRRLVKLAKYKFSQERYARPSNLKEIKLDTIAW